MNSSPQITIQELAANVANGHVFVEEPLDGKCIRIWDFHGFEHQPRRVARLLRAHGYKAKSLRDDPLVREFKRVNMEIVYERAGAIEAQTRKILDEERRASLNSYFTSENWPG